MANTALVMQLLAKATPRTPDYLPGLSLSSTAALAPSGSGHLVISDADLRIGSANAIDLSNWSGTVEIVNCRVRFNYGGTSANGIGIYAPANVTGISIRHVHLQNKGYPAVGVAGNSAQVGIRIHGAQSVLVEDVTTEDCATGVYITSSSNIVVRRTENHRSRGAYPRGAGVQIATCVTSLVEDSSDEPLPGISWTEDSFSNYDTSDALWRRLVVPMMSDSTSGRGIVVEGSKSVNVAVSDCELFGVYDGAFTGGLGAVNPSFHDMRIAEWNSFSHRGYGGSTVGGVALPAAIVAGSASMTCKAIYSGLPGVNPKGQVVTSPSSKNVLYNPGGAAVTVDLVVGSGADIVAQEWAKQIKVRRNSFRWRNPREKLSARVAPRIGSYWLPNPTTGADGLMANSLVSGAIVAALPGWYRGDPTGRWWGWYLDDNYTGEGRNFIIPAGSSGKTLTMEEAVWNEAGDVISTTTAGILIS